MPDPTSTRASSSDGSLLPMLRGALHLLGGQSIRLVAQSLYLILLTRSLGAESFSKVAALLALFLALFPFTCLGTPLLVVRGVARNPADRAHYWGIGLLVTATLGTLTAMILAVVAPGLLRIDFPHLPLFFFACGELTFFGLIQVLNAVHQGEERLERMARVLAALSLIRLAIMAAVQFTLGLDLHRFALAYFAGAGLTLLLALLVYARAWGKPVMPRGLGELREVAKDGFYVGLAASGRSFLLGLDKMLLPSLFGLTAAAQYAAGFRVLMFAFIPLQAVMSASFPRFFRQGGRSLADGMRLWRRVAPIAIAYACVVAVLLYFAAPWIEPLLGEEFTEVAEVIRFCVGLLILQALYVPLGDALTGADFLAFRSFSLIAAALCNLGLNLWLIPDYGWRGAGIAAYLSHVILIVLYLWRLRREMRAEAAAS